MKDVGIKATREIRAIELLASGNDAVTRIDEMNYSVRSQTGRGRYRVKKKGTYLICDCKDFQDRMLPCKHIKAVQIWSLQKAGIPYGTPGPGVSTQKKTYSQDWPAYDRAQKTELFMFDRLLSELVSNLPDPVPIAATGRPRIRFSEAVFCTVRKVYSTMSCRRSWGFLQRAAKEDLLAYAPSYAVSSRILNRKDLSLVLHGLIARSALPLASPEDSFAIDGTGFRTNTFGSYCQEKHGPSRRNN